jgi:hypothetical protein
MGDVNTGLIAYDGIGSSDLLLAHSWQEGRKIGLSWLPANGLPNAWGLIQLQQNTGRYISLSGSDKGGYEATTSLNWKPQRLGVQRTFLRTQGNQRLADRNEDGFRDQLAYTNYHLQHQLDTRIDHVNLSAYVQYFGQRQHGGEVDYDWKKQAGSDSIYGFGAKANQWIGGLSARHRFREGRDLQVNTNWRLQQEAATYGQRQLMSQERRTGIAANYRHEHRKGLSTVFSFYQRQVVQQHWDGWSFNPTWDRLAWGGQHRRFLTSKMLLEGSLSLDYHSASRWQLLPNLRFDYLLHKKIRLGVLGGRNYRWQQAVTALKPYLVSQREWLPQDYGPDRLWCLGGLLQSSQLKVANGELTYKLVYQARLLTEQLLTDPDRAGALAVYHKKNASPLQHLLLATLQARWNHFSSSIAYRWRDKPLPLRNSQGQAYFESRHSILAQLSYGKEINRTLQWIKLSTDYLLRSPQRLPGGEYSPNLHNWRCQIDLRWNKMNNKRWWPTVFMGAENLLNQRQDQLYAATDRPFSASFDGSSRWGNPVGRSWYAGLSVGF